MRTYRFRSQHRADILQAISSFFADANVTYSHTAMYHVFTDRNSHNIVFVYDSIVGIVDTVTQSLDTYLLLRFTKIDDA